jgi:heat-inducible transcriptional repressor
MQEAPRGAFTELNERSREIFRRVVDEFMQTGEPVGSRTISRRLTLPLSPASVRNVLSDLEEMGLLYAPHTSAGRLPTEAGLRLFIDGLLELGDVSKEDQAEIESRCAATGKSVAEALAEATSALSGLSRCAGLVFAPKAERSLKHLEFVHLGEGRAIVVLVTADGLVENRVIDIPVGTPPAALTEAANYLNARLVGRTLIDATTQIRTDIDEHQAQLDTITSRLVEAGLATWAGDKASGGSLIVKGQAHLLDEVAALSDLERVRSLFEALETQELLVRLLGQTEKAQGVQIFIGAQNSLFNLAGCSMIVAPFTGTRTQVVGAIGVIGPTRINYARIIPIVDYTAKVIGRLVG